MAIGEDFFGVALSGVTTFSDTIRASGVEFIPSSSTVPTAPTKLTPRPPTFLQQGGDGFLFSPENIRQKLPNGTPIVPEDDSDTADGRISPSETAELGGFFTNFSKVLANPASQKFLASLGMQISPHNTKLGEFGIGVAEANAQASFRKQLESGVSSGDAKTPGLSPEGRDSVLAAFNAEETTDRTLDRYDSEFALAERVEDRQDRQQLLDQIYRREQNAIEELKNQAINDARNSGDKPFDRVLRLNQTSDLFTEQSEVLRESLIDLDLDITTMLNKDSAPRDVRNKNSGYKETEYYVNEVQPLLDKKERIEKRRAFYTSAIEVLNQVSVSTVIPASSNVIEVSSEAEVQDYPIGTIVKYQGQFRRVE